MSASYPGANAQVVADTVAAPIEQQVNGVEDMMYMSSQCTNDGTYTLTVTFKLGTDLNIAQVLVQNRVVAGRADPARPGQAPRRHGQEEVAQHPDDRQPRSRPTTAATNLDLSNYATIQIRDELSRLPGVGDVTYLGPARLQHAALARSREAGGLQPQRASDVVDAVQAAERPGRRRADRPAADAERAR